MMSLKIADFVNNIRERVKLATIWVALALFILLFSLYVFVPFDVYLIILSIGLLVSQILLIVLVLIKLRNKKAMPREKFIIVLLACCIVTTVVFTTCLAGKQSGRLTVASGGLTHWEMDGSYSDSLKFQIPGNQYFYLDYSTVYAKEGGTWVQKNLSIGAVLDISVKLNVNLKPASIQAIEARCSDHFQLSPSFEVVSNTTMSSFTKEYHYINGMNTSTWTCTKEFSMTKDSQSWKQVLMYAFVVNIDENWIGNNWTNYGWSELNYTTEASGPDFAYPTNVEPQAAALSINSVPLFASFSDTWWLVSAAILAIFLVVMILSLVSGNTMIMTTFMLIIIFLSTIALLLMIIDELNADWVTSFPAWLAWLAQFLALMVGSIKWVVVVGAVTGLVVIATIGVQKLLDMNK